MRGSEGRMRRERGESERKKDDMQRISVKLSHQVHTADSGSCRVKMVKLITETSIICIYKHSHEPERGGER